MAKRKAPELSPEANAANAAGEARRLKEKKARRQNADKQRRFRESMKSQGYKAVMLWDFPVPSDKRIAAQGFRKVPAWERTSEGKSKGSTIRFAVRIREYSLNAAVKYPKIKKVLESAAASLAVALGDTPEERGIYLDYLEMVKLIGGEG